MLVKLGNLLFHYRNYLFPILYLGLFIPSVPFLPSKTIAGEIGLSFILIGIAIRSTTIGLEYIIRGGKNRKIYADNLVTGGVYSICRNPMYLGNLIILLGFGIFCNSLIFVFVFFPLYVFIYWAIIQAEEAYLYQKFGEQFIFYKRNVNAIWPSIIRLKLAFHDQKFNWKKVLFKEYNSLFIYFSGLFILMYYQDQINIRLLVYAIALLILLYFLVKMIKYKIL